nr:flagellin [Jiella sonneratiae]
MMTNLAAMTALQALKSTSTALERTQQNVSTGYRVDDAKDDAAYWSISTTMRSDVQSISAIQDGLGIASAMVDTAYTGLTSALDVVSRIKSLIVAAETDGVDRAKIQSEIAASQDALLDIAKSASFAGVNWLNTKIPDIQNASDDLRLSQIMSGIQRGSDGKLDLSTMSVDVAEVSLFNADGGGLLQADSRSPKTIGGIRHLDSYDPWTTNVTGYETYGPASIGSRATQIFLFDGPITFGASDTMSFDVTIGAEDDGNADLPAPYGTGHTTTLTINRALVDTVLPSAGGVVSTNGEWAAVLRAAVPAGDAPYVSIVASTYEHPVTHAYTYYIDFTDTQAWPGSEGTSMAISGFATTTSSSGGVGNTPFTDYGSTASEVNLSFSAFHVAQDVEINFSLGVYGHSYSYEIDRDTIETVLNQKDGVVESADEMVTVLSSIITNVPNLIIDSSGAGNVRLAIDRAADRSSGIHTGFSISNIDVNIEPLPAYDILDVDVEDDGMIDIYLQVVDAMEGRVTAAAAKMGAMQNAIASQRTYLEKLTDTANRGIGVLVDADMTEETTRLKALQTQEQLGLQALSLANGSPRALLSLFQ